MVHNHIAPDNRVHDGLISTQVRFVVQNFLPVVYRNLKRRPFRSTYRSGARLAGALESVECGFLGPVHGVTCL